MTASDWRGGLVQIHATQLEVLSPGHQDLLRRLDEKIGWTDREGNRERRAAKQRDRAVNPTFPANTSSLAFLICWTTTAAGSGWSSAI
jgi:hypothetical protein